MTKKDVLAECMKSKNGVILQEKNFKRKLPEMYDDLNNTIKDDIPFMQKLYNYLHDINHIPKTTCGKNRTFRNFRHGYNDFCSTNCECMIKSCNEKREMTSMSKYGVKHYMMLDSSAKHLSDVKLNYSDEKKTEIAEKKRKTIHEHYGDNYGKIIEQSVMRIYGVRNVSQVPEIAAKSKQSNVERHGGVGFASEKLRGKGLETCEKRHGIRNYTNDEKRRKTNEAKYGNQYYKFNIHYIRNILFIN